MTTRVFAAAIAALVLSLPAHPADARKFRHHRVTTAAQPAEYVRTRDGRYVLSDTGYAPTAPYKRGRSTLVAPNDARIVPNPPGCPPVLFCGCGVAYKVYGTARRFVTYNGRRLNLYVAGDWLAFPRAAPAAGTVMANRSHVRYIISSNGDGTALVYDPNSGGRKTRIHTVSLRGYTVVQPPSS